MKVWVTKYWETKGLYEESVEDPRDDDDGGYVITTSRYAQCFHMGSDCFKTRAEAVVNARQRAERKVKALEKQLAKVRKLARLEEE